MKKKFNWIIFLVIAILLVACGGTEQAGTETGGEEAAAPEGEKITLRLWSHQNAAFQAANEAIIQKFMEQNPDIEVKYETFEYDLFIQTLQTSIYPIHLRIQPLWALW